MELEVVDETDTESRMKRDMRNTADVRKAFGLLVHQINEGAHVNMLPAVLGPRGILKPWRDRKDQEVLQEEVLKLLQQRIVFRELVLGSCDEPEICINRLLEGMHLTDAEAARVSNDAKIEALRFVHAYIPALINSLDPRRGFPKIPEKYLR